MAAGGLPCLAGGPSHTQEGSTMPTIVITITWTNPNPNTIWNRLAAKLGREPTRAEAIAEVRRILREPSHA